MEKEIQEAQKDVDYLERIIEVLTERIGKMMT